MRFWIIAFTITMLTRPAFSTTTVPAPARHIPPVCAVSTHDRVRTDTTIEMLDGPAAVSHLRNLRSRLPGAFEKADALMRQKGFRPTDTVVVFRTLRQASHRERVARPGILLTQESETSSEGEVVVWSWDDGDPNTWEGEIYVDDYVDRVTALADGQFNIASDETFSLLWDHNVYWHQEPLGPYDQTANRNAPPSVLVASHSPASVLHALVGTQLRGSGYFRVGTLGSPFVRDWGACAATACTGFALRCWATGPGWVACMKVSCGASIVGCGVGAVIRNW